MALDVQPERAGQYTPPVAPKSLRLDRIITVLALGIAFIVMASIFAPDRTRAGVEPYTVRPVSPAPPSLGISTDPHEGMAAMGVLQDATYTVKMFAAPGRPLYSVYDRQGAELAVLLTAEQVEQRFPDLHITQVRFGTPMDADAGDGNGSPLMHAGSDDEMQR